MLAPEVGFQLETFKNAVTPTVYYTLCNTVCGRLPLLLECSWVESQSWIQDDHLLRQESCPKFGGPNYKPDHCHFVDKFRFHFGAAAS